jgi:hypothetical protein
MAAVLVRVIAEIKTKLFWIGKDGFENVTTGKKYFFACLALPFCRSEILLSRRKGGVFVCTGSTVKKKTA